MDLTASDWASAAFAQAWQVTTVAVAAAIVVRLFARNRPKLAHLLWLLVLIKCVTPPLWSSPTGAFSWLMAALPSQAAAVDAGPELPATIEAVELIQPLADGAPDENRSTKTADASIDSAPQPMEFKLRGNEIDTGSAADQPERGIVHPLVQILLAVWLVGTIALIALAAIRWLSCWQVIRRTRRPHSPALQAQVESLARRLGLRRRVGVIVTESRIGPAVIGWLRPVVLLPAAVVNQNSLRSLEPILAHELIHIRRGDLWVGMLQILARSFWWFHPLVWMSSRLITREAERCCDEEVIGELSCDPAEYARSLLAVLELKLKPVPVFPGVRPVEVTSRRLERIMSLAQGCRTRTPWRYRLAMLALAAVTLPGAALVATAEQQHAERPQRSAAEAPDRRLKLHLPAGEQNLEQIMIEARIFHAPPKSISALTADWSHISPVTPNDEQLNPRTKNAGDAPGGAGSQPNVKATFTVEKNLPVVTHMISTEDLFDLVQKVQDDVDCNAMFCPKCKVIDGHTATLSDTVQRTFVVRVDRVGPDRYQPKNHVVPEGVELQLKPRLLDDKKIQLAYELTVSNIRRVEEAEFKRAGATIALQVPEVAKYRLEGSAAVPVDKHLAIAGLSADRSGAKPRSMIVVLSAFRSPDTAPLKLGTGVNSDAGVIGNVRIGESQPPSDEEVLADLRKRRPLPARPADLRIVKELVQKSSDPARMMPLIGPAVMHHTVYKCTVYYTKEVGGESRQLDEVVYIDKVNVVPVVVDERNKQTRQDGAADKPRKAAIDNIHKQLEKRVTLSFKNTPLREVVRNLAKIGGVNIHLDQEGLAVEGVTVNQVVTIHLERSISLRSALNLILDPLNLGFAVENDVIKVTGKEVLAGQTFASVYSVADLVVPLPGKPGRPHRGYPQRRLDGETVTANFNTLIDLITSSVAPDSWNKTGGSGAISTYEKNLSLVVSQTRDHHNEIADLIESLRRIHDLQVAFRVDALTVDPSKFNLGLGNKKVRVLTAEAGEIMRELTTARQGPKLTVFNGRIAQLPLELAIGQRAGSWFQLAPYVSQDRKQIRVDLATSAGGDEKSAASATVPKGKLILLDVSDCLPDDTSTKQTVLLITPELVIHEEEELAIGRPLR